MCQVCSLYVILLPPLKNNLAYCCSCGLGITKYSLLYLSFLDLIMVPHAFLVRNLYDGSLTSCKEWELCCQEVSAEYVALELRTPGHDSIRWTDLGVCTDLTQYCAWNIGGSFKNCSCYYYSVLHLKADSGNQSGEDETEHTWRSQHEPSTAFPLLPSPTHASHGALLTLFHFTPCHGSMPLLSRKEPGFAGQYLRIRCLLSICFIITSSSNYYIEFSSLYILSHLRSVL